jgi:hypothetical protein
MSEKSKMPSDWALADPAIRLSVVCLIKIWNKVELENPSFRLEKRLVKFPDGHLDRFCVFSTCYNFGTAYESSTSLYISVLGGTNPL